MVGRPNFSSRVKGTHYYIQQLGRLSRYRSPMTQEPPTNPVAVSSSPAHAGFLFDRSWERLPATCGWLLVCRTQSCSLPPGCWSPWYKWNSLEIHACYNVKVTLSTWLNSKPHDLEAVLELSQIRFELMAVLNLYFNILTYGIISEFILQPGHHFLVCEERTQISVLK